MKSPIRRTQPLIEFVQIPNLVARDYRLSYRARGLLVELLSYPPGWETTIDDMAARAKREADKHEGCRSEGREAMRAAARELEHVGYLKRNKYRDENGRWATETLLSEDPLLAFALEQKLAPTPDRAQKPAVDRDRKPVVAPTCNDERGAEEVPAQDQGGKPGVGKPGVGFPGVNRKTVTNTDTSSSHLPQQRTAPVPPTAEEEGSSASTNDNRARLFLMQLPAPWNLGPADAARIAPQLAAAVSSLGLDYNDQLAAQIANNPGGINNYASVVEKHRIPNLKRPAGPRLSNLPPPCTRCAADHPASRTNAAVRLDDDGLKCRACHPDAAKRAA